MRFNLDNYETVEARLAKFWEEFPNGQVFTSIYYYDENRVVFKAEVYRDISDPRPVATGFAEEVRDASPVNRTSHVENAETSAIGRCLANWKWASKTQPRPSRQEMEKVVRREEQQNYQKPRNDADTVTKFREACVKAGLDPEHVAKEAGTDLNNLTSDSMPKLRDAFKKLQATISTSEQFVESVAKVFPTANKENYREIKDPDAPATPAQLGKLRALANAHSKNRAEQLEKIAEIVNRPVPKLDVLTKAQADMAIKTLESRSNA